MAWQEIAAWERFHAPLTGWEAKTLRRMSEDYTDQRAKAREPGCPAPYVAAAAETEAEVNERVNKQFAAMLAAIEAGKV